MISAAQLRLAARNLWRHRTRTTISLSAIAFGVVALLIAGGFIEWTFWAMRETAVHTGMGHLQISRSGFRKAGLADPSRYLLSPDTVKLDDLRKGPGVSAVSERLVLSGLASSGETTVAFIGEAVDPEADKATDKYLYIRGEPLASDDPTGVLLGEGLARELGVQRGDRVSFVVTLPGGGISAVEGHMRGTVSIYVKAYDDSAVRMPLALGRKLLKTAGAHLWVVALSATDRTDEAAVYVRSKLAPSNFETVTWLDLSDFYRKSVVLLSRQLDVVAILIGLMIVLGISNTLTMNVLERTGEIGTLMALGTPRREILRLFLVEGLLVGILGGLIGLGCGVALAQVLSWVGIPMPPPPGRTEGFSAEIILTIPLALSALVVAIGSTVLASLYPALKASRLPIVDALRHNR